MRHWHLTCMVSMLDYCVHQWFQQYGSNRHIKESCGLTAHGKLTFPTFMPSVLACRVMGLTEYQYVHEVYIMPGKTATQGMVGMVGMK